jgi:hypothetical protein
MSSNEHLEQPLWELIYELLSPEEEAALLLRITSDPELARAYSRVKLKAELVALAAKCDDTQGILVRPGEAVNDPNNDLKKDIVVGRRADLVAPKLRSKTYRAANWIVAAAAMGLVVMVAIAHTQNRPDAPRELTFNTTDRSDPPTLHPVRIVVTTSATWNKYTSNFLSVKTLRDGVLTAEPFDVTLLDDDGIVQGVHVPNETGTAHVELAKSVAALPTRLEVRARDKDSPPVTRSLHWARSDLSTDLTTDLDNYQPGDSIKYRTTALAFDQRKAAEVAVIFEVLDAQGKLIPNSRHSMTTEHGIADGTFEIDQNTADGKLTIRASSPNRAFTTQHREVLVRRLESVTNEIVWNLAFSRQMPPQPTTVVVQFYPEGGNLVAGLLNNVYFLAQDERGQPIDLAGLIVDEADNEVAQAKTVHNGRGKFPIRVSKDTAYRLIVQQPANVTKEISLPTVSPDATLVLHTSGQALNPGDPFEVTLRTRKPDRSLVLAAACQGRLVGWQTIDPTDFSDAGDGTSEYQCKLVLAPEASGVLEITVYDSSDLPATPILARLVYRQPVKRLNVVVHAVDSKDPGMISLELQITDELGQPLKAALSLSVVEQTVIGVPGKKIAKMDARSYFDSLVRTSATISGTYFLGTSDESAATSDEAAMAFDMQLATRSSRVAGSLDKREKLKDQLASEDYSYSVQSGGQSEGGKDQHFNRFVPIVLDNQEAIENKLAAARQATTSTVPTPRIPSHQTRRRWGTVLMFGGLLVLFAVLGLAVIRSLGRPRIWVPSVVTAGLVAVLGVFWMGSQLDPVGQVAKVSTELADKTAAISPTPNEPYPVTEAANAGEYPAPYGEYESDSDESEAAAVRKLRWPIRDSLNLESGSKSPAPREQRYAAAADFSKAEVDAEKEGNSMRNRGGEGGGGGRGATGGGMGGGAAGNRFGGGSEGISGFADDNEGHEGPAPDTAFKKNMARGQREAFDVVEEESTPLLKSSRQPNEEKDEGAVESPAGVPSAPSAAAAAAPKRAARSATRRGNKVVPADEAAIAISRERNLKALHAEKELVEEEMQRTKQSLFQFRQQTRERDARSSVLWRPLVITDVNGRTTVTFALPSPNSTFVLRVEAHSEGRVGSGKAIIKAR